MKATINDITRFNAETMTTNRLYKAVLFKRGEGGKLIEVDYRQSDYNDQITGGIASLYNVAASLKLKEYVVILFKAQELDFENGTITYEDV